MSGLVLELQQDALDPNTPVSSILRKALVISRKLDLAKVEAWIAKELNGYMEDEDVPEYRRVKGELKVWNPYNGWIPFLVNDPQSMRLLTERGCGQTIPEVEDLLRGDQDMLCMPFSPEIEQRLMKGMEIKLQPTLVVQRTTLVRIVESVRDMLLEWSLKLEKDGVLGEGMTFSAREREKAQGESVTYQIQNQTVVHEMHSSQIQQGTHGSSQVYESKGLDVDQIRLLVVSIRTEIAGSCLPKDTVGEADADLATIEAQIRSSKPKRPILNAALQSLQNVLEGAAGGALGNVIPALPALLNRLGQCLS